MKKTEVDAVIEQVKLELRSLFGKSKEKVGNALKKVFKEESICEEIKNALREEMAEGVISARTIELHCPHEWKHKTKPNNDKPSFSKPVEDKIKAKIARTNQGKSVSYCEPTGNKKSATIDDSSSAVQQRHSDKPIAHGSQSKVIYCQCVSFCHLFLYCLIRFMFSAICCHGRDVTVLQHFPRSYDTRDGLLPAYPLPSLAIK